MDALRTLPELVAEVAARISALPAPKNGQVRAIPDDRTVRYYVTLGLLDRPSAMRGRTALYGQKHVAQVVAIKRLQTMGRSLSEIQQLWPTLDDRTLARMSGVALPEPAKSAARPEFWKRGAALDEALGGPPAGPAGGGATALDADSRADAGLVARDDGTLDADRRVSPPPAAAPAGGAVELRIELSPSVVLSLSITDDSVAMSPADVRAIRAAAAPLLAELASRRLASHPGGDRS